MMFALRWSCVLGIALFLPIALPAGGAQHQAKEIVSQQPENYLFAGDCCCLRSSPLSSAPILRKVPKGTPIKLLRRWNLDENDWVQVQVVSNELIDETGLTKRGWLNV